MLESIGLSLTSARSMPFLIIVLLAAAHCSVFAQHQPVSIPSLRGIPTQSLDPDKDIDQYLHHVWKTEQGLPQNSAWALCQTRDGYLWIGTQEGLVRYDGIRFSVFNKQNVPAMRSNVIASLLEDNSGALWIGTRGGGVLRLHEGTFICYSTQNGLSNDDVTSLLQDRAGTIWIGTSHGLNQFRNGVFTFYTTHSGLSNDAVTALVQDRQDALWIGTMGGLNLFHNGTFKHYTTQHGLSNDAVTSLVQDRNGTLWIGTNNGLNQLENGVFKQYTTQHGLSNNVIRTLLFDRSGTLWIGGNGGVQRMSNNVLTVFSTKNGLSNDDVRSLLQDRDGALWIGTHAAGINRLQNGSIVSYSSKNGLSIDAVTSVMGDSEYGDRHSTSGAVWVGTYGGGLNYFRDGIFTHYSIRNGLSSDVIRSLLQDRDGTLWVGTIGGGLNQFKNGTFTAITTKNGLSNDFVWSLQQTHDGALWIGTEGGGLNRYHNGKMTLFNTKNGLSNDFVRVILEDRNHENTLWIGTYGGGVNYWNNGKWTHFTTQDGLSNNFIRSLLQDREGTLWIGTQGGGLNRFKNGKFTTFTTKDGLFDDGAWCILEDDFGHLWMSCNKGIYRVNKADLNAFADGKISHIPCKSFGVADGMKSIECNAGNPSGWKTQDGRLWFPTMAGVLAISPNKFYTNPIAPPVIIEEIKADSVSMDLRSASEVAPEAQKFEFHYTATSFLAPEKVQFKYLLEGYDDAWVNAGGRRTAYYTNLPHGRQYRFRVIACNNDGVWNDVGASAMFYVAPYFWETWWFYGLCTALIGFSAYQGFHWRLNRLRMRAETLERLVDERTVEVLRQAKEIQHANTELQEKNIELKEASHFKTQMLSMASHDLKNPLSNMILLTQFLAKDFPDDSIIQEYATDMLQVSRQMLNLVYDLLDTAARDMEKKQMDIHFEVVDAYNLVTEILAHYAPQAEEKRQQFIVHCQEDCVIDGDFKRLPQVIENLLSNAIKYSPFEKRIWVRLEKSEEFVRFSVRDEGPGISREDQEQMFGFFQRLSALPTGGENSTGVGLAIVKQIVELHGGHIWVESALGEGAEFIVKLPMKQIAAS